MIPAAVLAVLVVHQERVGWLASVTAGCGGGCSARLLVLALLVVGVFFALGFLLPTSERRTDVSVPGRRTLVGLLAVILLTTPLQAAAEEVGFRGYLTQAVSSWFARPAVGIAAGVAVSAAASPWPTASRTPGCSATGSPSRSSRPGWPGAPAGWRRRSRCTSRTTWSAWRSRPSTGSLEESLTASTLEWRFAVLDVVMMLTFASWSTGWCAGAAVVTRARFVRPRRRRLSWAAPAHPAASGARDPLGYGVIGSPTDSGSVSLGSSPGTPARQAGGAVR